jgi:hypothetical protein
MTAFRASLPVFPLTTGSGAITSGNRALRSRKKGRPAGLPQSLERFNRIISPNGRAQIVGQNPTTERKALDEYQRAGFMACESAG